MADISVPTSSAPSTPAPAAPASSTPSAVVPNPSSASTETNSSMESAVDSLLASPASGGDSTPATPATQDGVQPADAGATSQTAPPEGTPASPAVDPAKPVEQAAEVEDLDPGTDEDLDAAQADAASASNLLDLKKSRGQRIYGAYKAFKAITETLGHEPTAEEIQTHLESYSDRLAMEDEFASGDPGAQTNWLNYWHSQNPQAMTNLAGQLGDYFAGTNQQAYVKMAMPVLGRFLNQLYVQAQQEPNPELQKAFLYTARMTDWYLNGNYRDDASLPKPPDAMSQREAALSQREQQIQQFNQQQVAASAAAWNQTLEQANTSALSTEAQKALAPLKSVLSDRMYKAAERDFEGTIREHLAKDVEGERIYQIRRNQAARGMSSGDIPALAQSYAQRVARAVRAVAPSFLKEAGVAAQAASTQRQAALQAAADAGKAPQSAGAPRQQSIMPSPQQYASRGDQMEANIDNLLGVRR